MVKARVVTLPAAIHRVAGYLYRMPNLSPIAAGTALTVWLAACSAVSTQQPPQTDGVIAKTNEEVTRSYEGASPGTAIMNAPPDKTLNALSAAYADLGIEVKLWDPPNGQVGNKVFTKMYRLGGAPLSQYVGCGFTTTGQAADSYRITMSLTSQVTPVAGGSKVETSLTAYAEDIASSKGTIACQTRGALEERVNQLAAKHLGG